MPPFDLADTYSCSCCPWTHPVRYRSDETVITAHRLWHLYEAVKTAGDTFGPGDEVGAVAEAEVILIVAREGA
jgi:hypothetical protein